MNVSVEFANTDKMTITNQLCNAITFTHPGHVRPYNEDALLSVPEQGLWVVADGMGGHEKGDVASNLLVSKLGALSCASGLSAALKQVDDVVLEVNCTLIEMAAASPSGSMIGSTLVGVLVRGNKAICFWAGDSRLYLYREEQGQGTMVQVSTDHSAVQQLVKSGMITQEESDIHPAGNIIVRAVGASASLVLDIEALDLLPKDRLLLCSDGLYKELSAAEMARCCALDNTLETASGQLSDAVLASTAGDNVSFILIGV